MEAKEMLRIRAQCEELGGHEVEKDCYVCPLYEEVKWTPDLVFEGSVGSLHFKVSPCNMLSELAAAIEERDRGGEEEPNEPGEKRPS